MSGCICQDCKSTTSVIDSRPSSDGTTVRRRRVCDACGFRFTTVEVPAELAALFAVVANSWDGPVP